MAFRPAADVLCLFFGVGQRTCILNKTYGFLNQKQKNKPKTKLHNEIYFSIQQIDKNWKRKKKSYHVLVRIWYSPLGGCVSWCSHFGKQFGITQSSRRCIDNVKLYRPLVGKLLSLRQKTYVRTFTLTAVAKYRSNLRSLRGDFLKCVIKYLWRWLWSPKSNCFQKALS